MTIKTFAQVDKEGNVVCVSSFEAHDKDNFEDPTGNVRFILPPAGVETLELLESYKWEGKWKSVGKKPSRFHKWSKTGWDFDMEAAWREVRQQRAMLLSSTDWKLLAVVPEETKARYKTYRQALRDITTQFDPTAIVWPTPPI